MKKKVHAVEYHWFCFALFGLQVVKIDEESGEFVYSDDQVFKNVFKGFKDRKVNIPRLKLAMKEVQMTHEDCLQSVSYLGKMTEEDFIGPQREETK